MPPGMVSIRCLRSVGLFSRTKEIPAWAATSRKRMGVGGEDEAAAKSARGRISPGYDQLLPGRANLRFTRDLVFLLLIAPHDLLIFCHGGARLLAVARRTVGVR